MERVTVTRPTAPIRATIRLPRSKSISNRALICASLAGDLSCVRDLSDAEDTLILYRLLLERPAVMHCGLGGTTLRFLLAWASVQEGEEHRITGEPRLLERPHDALVNALLALGADITREANGYRVRGRKLAGGTIRLDSPISSQYISALMMIAPLMHDGLRIDRKGRRLSEPYVRMTAKVMDHFGVEELPADDAITIPPGANVARPFTVPPDWSAAAFWYEIAALANDAEVLLTGLRSDGMQGDERVAGLLDRATVSSSVPDGTFLRSIELSGEPSPPSINLTDSPDLFQPLAFSFAGIGWPVNFFGLDTLPMKESNRLLAVQDALAQLTGERHTGAKQLGIMEFRELNTDRPFPVHGDHRMAMALAPLALVCDRITILDPGVVKKSYPTYWDDLRKAGFGVEFG